MDIKQKLIEYFTPKEGTGAEAKTGGLFVLDKIFYLLFKSPYVIWTMSNARLCKVREQKRLDIPEIKSDIPYIVFLVRYVIEFLLDCLIFLSVVLAPVIAILAAATADFNNFDTFVSTFATLYYLPLALRLAIEVVDLIIKYGKYLLKAIYYIVKLILLPAILVYHFLDYLAKKCASKADKYDTKKN